MICVFAFRFAFGQNARHVFAINAFRVKFSRFRYSKFTKLVNVFKFFFLLNISINKVRLRRMIKECNVTGSTYLSTFT